MIEQENRAYFSFEVVHLAHNINTHMSTLESLKKDIFEYTKLRLGDGMVDVELDPAHLEMAYSKAVQTYRARAQNAEEESYAFLTLQEDQQEYILPQEITTVRQIFRRSIGSSSSSAANQFEPFEAGYINTYLLTAGRAGGLLSYELYTQYQEQTAKMFGGFINFTFNPVSKKLTIVRRPQSSGEEFLLWTYNMKPEVSLLKDFKISVWIKDYTYSLSKYTLGEARSKYGSIAGPQGGTQLNGDALKSEAKEEIDKLMEDLKNFSDGSSPLLWVIG
jgi:hypothetical protein